MGLQSAPDLGTMYEGFVGMHFKMLDGKTVVNCIVTTEALQDKAARNNMSEDDFASIFETFRSEIEAIADRQYAAGMMGPRVTSADLV